MLDDQLHGPDVERQCCSTLRCKPQRGSRSCCASAEGVHPLAARRHHVDIWVRHLSETPQPRTGRPASPASIARRLSCLSKFYDYGIKDAELLEHSPGD